jgi:hypothetical protein
VSNLAVCPESVHPDYRIEECDGILSKTGKLEVLKVVSKSSSGPRFTARWDQRAERLDVDIFNVSNPVVRKFKNNKHGYAGHHTSRTGDPDKRVFQVTIKIPEAVIFDGTVSFSNAYNGRASMQATSGMGADATVIPANQLPPIEGRRD